MFPLVSICQKLNLCQKTYFQNLWDSYLIYFPKVIPSYCNPRKYLEISKPFFFFWMIATNQTFHCYQTLGDSLYSQKKRETHSLYLVWSTSNPSRTSFLLKKKSVVLRGGKWDISIPTLFWGSFCVSPIFVIFNLLHLFV